MKQRHHPPPGLTLLGVCWVLSRPEVMAFMARNSWNVGTRIPVAINPDPRRYLDGHSLLQSEGQCSFAAGGDAAMPEELPGAHGQRCPGA